MTGNSIQLRAIDVSGFQHPDDAPIDWAAVRRSGVRACFVKASEDGGYENPWLARDHDGCERHGILTGAYHFCHPGATKPDDSLAAFVAAIGPVAYDLGLVLDLEEMGGLSFTDLGDWAHQFLDLLAAHRFPAVLYCDRYYLANLPGAPWGHRLWLASPGQRPRREVYAWQRGTGATDGIEGLVDHDVVNWGGCSGS